jgi:hypothetical protein
MWEPGLRWVNVCCWRFIVERTRKRGRYDADLHYCLGETYRELGNREGAEQACKVLREISAARAEALRKRLASKSPDQRASPTSC